MSECAPKARQTKSNQPQPILAAQAPQTILAPQAPQTILAPQAPQTMYVSLKLRVCFPESTNDVYAKGKELNVYSISESERRIIHHRKLTVDQIQPPRSIFPFFQITQDNENFLLFNRYHKDGQRGGQIMDNVNGIWTLVGLGAGGTSEISVAFRISSLQEQLCEVVGVCHPEPIPVPTPTTSGTSSKTPEAPSSPPIPPPEPSREAPPPPAAPPAKRREDEEADEDYEM